MTTQFIRIVLTLRIMRITPLTNAKVGLLIIIGRVVASFLIMKIGMWLSAMINASRIFSLAPAWFGPLSSPPKWSLRCAFPSLGLGGSVSTHAEIGNFIC
jgi:hypothetical protein